MVGANPIELGMRADAGVREAVVGRIDVKLRDQFVELVEERAVADLDVVQDRRVCRIDAAFERLQEIAVFERLRDVAVFGRRAHEFVIGRRRLQFARPQVRPDHPAAFPGRVGVDRDLRLEERVRRLRRHVDAGAVAIELPAVIDAAQSAFFVAAEEHRRAPVRAEGIDQADLALRVAKRDQVLAEQLDAHGRAVGLRHFLDQQRRDPVAPEQVAHRRAGPDAGQAFVILRTQHIDLTFR